MKHILAGILCIPAAVLMVLAALAMASALVVYYTLKHTYHAILKALGHAPATGEPAASERTAEGGDQQ